MLFLTNLARRCLNIIVTAWIILGLTLLLIVGIDMACSLISMVSSSDPNTNYFTKVDSYKGADWLGEYYKEFISAYNTHWRSYVYWRRKPFKGKYINVDERGIRHTLRSNLPEADHPKTIKIFMFGGSTMWGEGVRDDYTIPSLLVKALSDRKIKAEIVNYGETGYVSTQELIELELQLQQGIVPDLAIFYDGVNDVYAAYQSGSAGLPQNEWKRDLEYNISSRYRQLRKVFLVNFMDQFYLGNKLKIVNKLPPKIIKSLNINGLDEDIVKIYLNNIKIIEALGRTYGFTPIYFWQPVIYYKKNLSKFEENFVHDDYKKLYYNTYGLIRKDHAELSKYHFYNISEIFAETKEPLYIDYCHVNEVGNRIIAERMANDLLEIIKSKNASKVK